jgi:hypothetical protein
MTGGLLKQPRSPFNRRFGQFRVKWQQLYYMGNDPQKANRRKYNSRHKITVSLGQSHQT